jgi:hypothetical protein
MAYTRVRFKAPQTLFGERGLPFWAKARLAAINWHRKRALVGYGEPCSFAFLRDHLLFDSFAARRNRLGVVLSQVKEPAAGSGEVKKSPVVGGKATMPFDYGLPAELFAGKRRSARRQRLGCRRFPSAAEAIRFTVEDFPAVRTLGAWMQVGEERYDSEDIHRLYERNEYPLQRRTS